MKKSCRRPRLLDLFCCAGGAATGYHRAGFDVVGVDINDQPHYPFEFHRADALTYPLEGFDMIHASPPCQKFSTLKNFTKKDYPDLIGITRNRIKHMLYVIENVYGAPLYDPIRLCGSSFGLGVWRHRYFESSGVLLGSKCCHKKFPNPIDVTGTGGRQKVKRKKLTGGQARKPCNIAEARTVMGIDWMTRKEISQAVPPAYTEWIGRQLLEQI